MRHHLILAACLCVIAPAALADICKYRDAEGIIHYSQMPPEKGWELISCSEGSDNPKAIERERRQERDAQMARARIKIGMTEGQMRAAIDPFLAHAEGRRTVESASGKTEWIKFRGFEVVLQNGRVAKIIY